MLASMSNRPILHTVVFNGDGDDFSTTHQAEAWAKEHGFEVGSMCHSKPRGLARDCSYIAKWHNLTERDKAQLDGVLVSDDPRHGPVRADLYVKI